MYLSKEDVKLGIFFFFFFYIANDINVHAGRIFDYLSPSNPSNEFSSDLREWNRARIVQKAYFTGNTSVVDNITARGFRRIFTNSIGIMIGFHCNRLRQPLTINCVNSPRLIASCTSNCCGLPVSAVDRCWISQIWPSPMKTYRCGNYSRTTTGLLELKAQVKYRLFSCNNYTHLSDKHVW